jgi:invasion protein IalB
MVGLMVACAQAAGGAQTPAPGFDVSGWRVDCTTKAGVIDCAAMDQVTVRGTNQQLIVMTVRIAPDTKKPVVLIQLPLGIAVANGLTLTIGEAPPQTYPIQTCTPGGCFAGTALADRQLESMRTSAQLRVAWGSLEKQTTTVTMPLTGFAACYAKLK